MNPIPHDEEDLVAETALLGVLEVEDSIAAIISGQGLNELLIGGRLGGSTLDDDFGVLSIHLVQDIAESLAELKLVVLIDASVSNLDT